jgi:cupin 2 domain-containing protein
MSPEKGNLFASIPDAANQEIFTKLIDGDNVKIERIVSKGQSSPESGWYDQDTNEWVIVLEGEARVSFESGDVFHLASGDYLNIPAHTRHKVLWTHPDTETIWLAVHYN